MFKTNIKNKNWPTESSKHIEDVGYCIVEGIVQNKYCEKGIDAIKDSYKKIIELIGKNRLKRAGETGVVRAPMYFNNFFFLLLNNPHIQLISNKLVAETSILHLQNGFIFPKHNTKENHADFQYKFHGDFPRYMKGYMASINVLITFSNINEDDEVFYLVPGTHQKRHPPGQDYCTKNKISISSKAGGAIIFDSTLRHCAGPNYSFRNFYGVNHQFTHSFFKQQIDYVRLLGEEVILSQEERVQQMLGYYTRVVTNLNEYYQPEDKRLYRPYQG